MNPCEGCAADCCRHYDVVVLGWDVYRIARDLSLPPESFVELQAAPAPDLSHQLVIDAEAVGDRYRRLALRKEAGACVFLLSIDGKGRCGVYGSRPDACRSYPAVLDGELFTLAKREYCPPGAWEDIDEAAYRPRYRLGQRQRALFDVISDGWNERILRRRERRSPSDFFAFLLRTYAALEARQPSWFGDTFVAEEQLRDEVALLLVETGWL